MERITIVGLGLIGGSMGLALKRAKGMEIIGYARKPQVASRARQLGAVDETAGSLTAAVEKANIVIIATPALAIREVLGQIARHLPRNCVVTDTASTKEAVMEWASDCLPQTVSFIGGHPMAGKETSGIDEADANLFMGCTYCLTPPPGASPEAVQSMVDLVELIGANPFFIDAAEHDSFVAGISHLPILISAALVSATTKSDKWPQMSRLAATGFRDLSRLASGDPIMSRDICLTNRAAILRWLDDYIGELERYRRLLAEGSEELEEVFVRARDARQRWVEDRNREAS